MEQIKGFEGRYEIHLTGTPNGQPAVFSLLSNKYLKPAIWKNEFDNEIYLRQVLLDENGKYHTFDHHRLVGEHFIHNDDPENKVYLDHINGNRKDNRIENLRWVTHSENSHNCVAKKRKSVKPDDTTESVVGVTWDKNREKWSAQICINKKKIALGRFPDKQDAIKARKDAEEKYYPNIKKH